MPNKSTPFLGLLYLFLLSMSKSSPNVLFATPPPGAASEAPSSKNEDAPDDDVATNKLIIDTGTSAHVVNEHGKAYFNPERTVALAPNACLKHPSPEVVRKTCPKYHESPKNRK
jgi:hypothetical protein